MQLFRTARRTAEQSQSNRCHCPRCAFSRRAAAVSAVIGTGPWFRLSEHWGGPKALPVKYRRFTGRRYAQNTVKAIEIVMERVRTRNRRITGPKNRKQERKHEDQGYQLDVPFLLRRARSWLSI